MSGTDTRTSEPQGARFCVSWIFSRPPTPVIKIPSYVAAGQMNISHLWTRAAFARPLFVRQLQPPSARYGTGAESIMRLDVAPCGLIMSKCLRAQMRAYRCWRVRRAPLHPRQRALSTPIRVPPRRCRGALRRVRAAVTARWPLRWPTYSPRARGRASAETARSCSGSTSRSRTGVEGRLGSARLDSARLDSTRRAPLSLALFSQSFSSRAPLL